MIWSDGRPFIVIILILFDIRRNQHHTHVIGIFAPKHQISRLTGKRGILDISLPSFSKDGKYHVCVTQVVQMVPQERFFKAIKYNIVEYIYQENLNCHSPFWATLTFPFCSSRCMVILTILCIFFPFIPNAICPFFFP